MGAGLNYFYKPSLRDAPGAALRILLGTKQWLNTFQKLADKRQFAESQEPIYILNDKGI